MLIVEKGDCYSQGGLSNYFFVTLAIFNWYGLSWAFLMHLTHLGTGWSEVIWTAKNNATSCDINLENGFTKSLDIVIITRRTVINIYIIGVCSDKTYWNMDILCWNTFSWY